MTKEISTDSKELPERTTTYIGPLTDTGRWDAFRDRADDVFICTPPKCGTTWTQAICANLIFGTPDFEGKITDISPWVDSKIEASEICMETLDSQRHRRFIKTHTPLDGVPYFEPCEYLIVYRDPKDVYFSVRNHLLNMLDPPHIPQLANDPREGFRAWIAAPFEPGLGDQRSLAAFTQHFSSYWRYRHLDNFHFFHYSDMKRDLRASIRRIADILKIDISQHGIDDVCEAVSLAEMKKKPGVFVPASGKPLFKSDEGFFSSGSNEQWRGVLETVDIEAYTKRINHLLSPAEVKWIEGGNG